MIKLYGIPNCDSVKKARKMLDELKISYEFINFKSYTPTESDINRWKIFSKDWPINKRGTTFRKIKTAFEKASDTQKIDLIKENLSVIKRPILQLRHKVLAIGVNEEVYRSLKKAKLS